MADVHLPLTHDPDAIQQRWDAVEASLIRSGAWTPLAIQHPLDIQRSPAPRLPAPPLSSTPRFPLFGPDWFEKFLIPRNFSGAPPHFVSGCLGRRCHAPSVIAPFHAGLAGCLRGSLPLLVLEPLVGLPDAAFPGLLCRRPVRAALVSTVMIWCSCPSVARPLCAASAPAPC